VATGSLWAGEQTLLGPLAGDKRRPVAPVYCFATGRSSGAPQTVCREQSRPVGPLGPLAATGAAEPDAPIWGQIGSPLQSRSKSVCGRKHAPAHRLKLTSKPTLTLSLKRSLAASPEAPARPDDWRWTADQKAAVELRCAGLLAELVASWKLEIRAPNLEQRNAMFDARWADS